MFIQSLASLGAALQQFAASLIDPAPAYVPVRAQVSNRPR